MFHYQGKRLVEVGDSPLALGSRSIGDPFPQYWHKQLPLGFPGTGLSIIGPLTINPCPVTIQGDCSRALLVENAAGTDMFYVNTTASGSVAARASLSVYTTNGAAFAVGNSGFTPQFTIDTNAQKTYLWDGAGSTWGEFNLPDKAFYVTGTGKINITGSNNDALLVERTSGTNVLRVDTNNQMVVVGAGPTTTACLSIGEEGPGVVSGYGVYKQAPGGMYFNGDTRVVLHNPPTTLDRLIFGTIGGTTVGQNTFVFGQDVQLLGGFALNRTLVSSVNNVLPIAAEYTYVGYTGADQANITITLPPTGATYLDTGAKPGQMILIKDETGVVTHKLTGITISGAGGDTIDGLANVTINEGGHVWLQSDGTNWFKVG